MTQLQAPIGKSSEEGYFVDILSENIDGACILSLPANLRAYQGELEALLGKVFAGRACLPDNLALAQQMSLNWCLSKCREVGISFDYDVMTTGMD